jgi:cytochrome bd ubiquinol oxidase subunit I
MRVEDAVTPAPGIRVGYYALLVVYAALTTGTVYVLRRIARSPAAPRGDDTVPQQAETP